MLTDPTALYRLRDSVYAADLLIVAIADLDVFTFVSGRGSVDPSTLLTELEVDARAGEVMITYLAALGLLDRQTDGSVAVSALAAEHLVAGSQFDLRDYFASLRQRPGCRDLLAVLRTGTPGGWASGTEPAPWTERLEDVQFAREITAAMDARGRFLAPALAVVLDDLPADRVLDVGGGSGMYACALVDRRADRRATVLERPPVDGVARTLLAERGGYDRVEVLAGDMFADGLPAGHDLHLFSHVLHDWGEEHVRQLVAASFDALLPGGWLVDHDTHLHDAKDGPLAVAEYSVLLMHSTPGRCRAARELAVVLEDVGFTDIACRPTAAHRSAILARKPA